MYSIAFPNYVSDSLTVSSLTDKTSTALSGINHLILCAGPVPSELPEFINDQGCEDFADYKGSLLDIWNSSVADIGLTSEVVLNSEGKPVINFKPVPNYPKSTFGWIEYDGVWEKFPDSFKIKADSYGPESLVDQSLDFPSDALNVGSAILADFLNHAGSTQDVSIEFETETEMAISAIKVKHYSTYAATLEYWSGAEWVAIQDLGTNTASGDIVEFDEVTASKWRVRSNVIANSHYLRVYVFTFISRDMPVLQPPKTVTHAYLLSSRDTESMDRNVGYRPVILMTVGDITQNEPVTLLDLEVGDDHEAQFMALTLKIEELDSDKV